MSVLWTLKRHVQRKFKSLGGIPLQYTAQSVLTKQWARRATLNQESHKLAGQLIVNLTSYPPRFDTLHLTL